MIHLLGCFVSGADVDAVIGSGTGNPSETGVTETGSWRPPGLQTLEVGVADPSFGVDSGGTRATVSVGGLGAGADATVFFGDARALVVEVRLGELVVETPSSSVTGPVVVRVETADGAGEADPGFTYWTDGRGSTGAMGIFQRIDYTGGYWGATLPDPSASISFGFVEPAGIGFADLYVPGGAIDTCARDHVSSEAVRYLDPGVAQVEVEGAADTIGLTGYGGAFSAGVDPALMPPAGATVSLAPLGAPPPWDAPYAVSTPILSIPDSIVLTEPNLSGANLAFIDPAVQLRWAAGDASYVLARLSRYRDEVVEEEVTCVMVDDGSFLVPDLWTGWSGAQDYVVILVARVAEADFELPHDRSTSAAVGARGTVGAALPLAW